MALGKNTNMSSLYGALYPSSKGVDGITAQNGNFFSTLPGADGGKPWWVVDLGATYSITGFTIWNRFECCQSEYKGGQEGQGVCKGGGTWAAREFDCFIFTSLSRTRMSSLRVDCIRGCRRGP